MKKPAHERLKELDNQSVKFFDANQLMLSEGYSEAEILEGTYRFAYDGKPNEIKKADSLRNYYEKHPKVAREMADEILKAHGDDEHYNSVGRTASYLAASRMAPGHHARSFYDEKFASEAGIPYFSTLGVLLVTFIIVLKYDLPTVILYIVPIVYIVGFKVIDRIRHG
jgi:hypothetical protein